MKKSHITRLATIAGVTGALAIATAATAAEQKQAPQKVTVTVITATPEQIAHFDRLSAQSNSGMRAYVDADTKQLRAATQEDLAQAAAPAARAAAPAAAKRSAAVVAEPAAKRSSVAPQKLAGGTKKAVLDESYLSYAVATIGKDGKVKQICVDPQPSQQAALDVAAQSGVDSHEK